MGMLQASDPVALLETKRQNTTTSADHPVFVAGDGRRARRLRHAAVVVGVLAALWIVGLGVGTLGFGSLPGVALVKGAREDSRPAPAPAAPAPAAGDRAGRSLLSADVSSVRRDTAQRAAADARRSANGSSTRHSARATRRAAHAPATAPTPVNPAQRTRGWARKGYAAPRGQLRKAAPSPPRATSRGRRVGQTTTTPATPPAVPPGQARKALDPPPPPPPPKKG
jgi:hypothetical protein